MRPPEFWNHTEGREAAKFLRTLLSPFGWVYAQAGAYRIRTTKPYNPGVPVICVGNATLGGTGKTPVTRYLLESLARANPNVVALSRGYGGTEKGPIIVTPKHTAEQVGDEPKMLSHYGRVWIAAGRDDGARAAVSSGAKAIIMDDGLQNPTVLKTLSLLVVDAETGFGNGYVFPAGPLREPVKSAISRSDAVILMQPHADYGVSDDLLAQFKPLPVIRAYLKPTGPAPTDKLFAFAGIGRPNKFFDALRRGGAEVVDGLAFADHYKYTIEDMKSLADMAKEYDARLITTEKDFMRVPKSFHKMVIHWPVEIVFEDELTLRQILHPIVHKLGG